MSKYVFDVYKLHGDYYNYESRSIDMDYNKKFYFVITKIILISLAISIAFSLLIWMSTSNASNDKSDYSKSANITNLAGNHTNDTHAIPHQCDINPYDSDFYDKVSDCLFFYKCKSSGLICNEILGKSSKISDKDITCPVKLGRKFPLEKRRDISNRLRDKDCFIESYSWLSGIDGAEAENARGAWRAMVCPDNPAIFSDPDFALLGPPPDGGCRR